MYYSLASAAWAQAGWTILQTPESWSDRKPREQFVCRRWQQPPRGSMVEWRSPMHTSGSHNLMATSTGHGAYLPSAWKDSGCLAALSQHRNVKPGGTLKMSPWPWLREDRLKLTHPERCLSNCSCSLPKQSYRFPSNLRQGKLITALVLTAASHHTSLLSKLRWNCSEAACCLRDAFWLPLF